MSFNPGEYFAQLEMHVNIDSGRDCLEGSTRLFDFYENALKGCGLRVRRFVGGNQPDYLVATNHNTDHFDIMYLGHIDTAFEKGTAKASPYHTDGVHAYGPGIADMKAGSLAIYHFIKNLPQETLSKLSICVFLNADEEIFWRYTAPVVSDYASRSDHVFIFESAFPDGSHCVNRKGRVVCNVEFTGVTAHAGYIYETRNASAILEMSRWIQELNALSNRELGISFNAGTVQGGTATNMVPSKASLGFEFRMWDIADQKIITDRINYLLTHPEYEGVVARVVSLIDEPPMSPNRHTAAFLEHIRDVMEDAGYDFNLRPRGGMSGGNIVCSRTPVCIDGLGPRGELNTGDRNLEKIDMHSVEECIRINTILFEDIASRAEGGNA